MESRQSGFPAGRLEPGLVRHIHRLMRPVVLVLLTVLPFGGALANATDDALRWLDRMVMAAQSLNYDGTFIYRQGQMMESVRIIHRGGPSGERSRMIALTGAAREVLKDERRVVCILPDDQSVLVVKNTPNGLFNTAVFEANEGFSKYYNLSVMGGDRVAGRSTQVVYVEPQDEFRFGYRLWVDTETGLMLRSVLVGEAGAALEEFAYTTIELPNHIPDELLEPEISGEWFTWYTNESSNVTDSEDKNSRWKIDWLPEGFMMTDRERDTESDARMPVEHLVYTDGLASISIFIEELKETADPLDGLSAMGAVNAYGSIIGGYQVTVVGEVPVATVQRIATSVRLEN